MIEILNVTLYKCEFCGKPYRKPHYALKHESTCNKNPVNDRPCFGCIHLTQEETTIDYDNNGTRKVNLLCCSKKEIWLYPPKVEAKGNAFDIDENYPMPKICTEFETHDDLPF